MQGKPDRPFVPCHGLVEPFEFPPSPKDTSGSLQEVGGKEDDVGDQYRVIQPSSDHHRHALNKWAHSDAQEQPAMINLHLQVSRLLHLELPCSNQAVYLLPGAIKPTHCFPGRTRVREPGLRKGPSLTKHGANPHKSKTPVLCYSPKL